MQLKARNPQVTKGPADNHPEGFRRNPLTTGRPGKPIPQRRSSLAPAPHPETDHPQGAAILDPHDDERIPATSRRPLPLPPDESFARRLRVRREGTVVINGM